MKVEYDAAEMILPNQRDFIGLMPAGWIAIRKTCEKCKGRFNTGRSPNGKSQNRCAGCFESFCSTYRGEQ